MNTETMMMQFPVTRNAWIQAGTIWKGVAIRCEKSTAAGDYIDSEKTLKFNQKSMKQLNRIAVEKADPRLVGGEDRMRFKVGKPGSRERVDALALQYTSLSEEEISPFVGE